jgi:hypothetical protein
MKTVQVAIFNSKVKGNNAMRLIILFFSQIINLGILTSLAVASDFQTPRTLGLAGSGHGAPLHGDPIYLNPSFISFLQTYNLGFGYSVANPSPNDPAATPFRGMNWNVNVTDGRSELFQAGVAFARREDYRMLHLAISKSVMPAMSVGLGGKFFFPQDGATNQIMDGGLSASYIFHEMFQASLIVDNLLGSQAGLAQGLNREIILGTKVNLKGIAMFYIDPHFYPNAPAGVSQYGHEVGAELTIFKDLFLRGGLFKNSMVSYLGRNGSGWALGAGWITPRLSLDYGFSSSTEPVSEQAHSFGFTVYL